VEDFSANEAPKSGTQGASGGEKVNYRRLPINGHETNMQKLAARFGFLVLQVAAALAVASAE